MPIFSKKSGFEKTNSHYILIAVQSFVILSSILTVILLTNHVSKMRQSVQYELEDTMNEKVQDPNGGSSYYQDPPSSAKKAKVGLYLERIVDWSIKKSNWEYDFYLWFSWNYDEVDLIGDNSSMHKDKLPFVIVNGEVLNSELVAKSYDTITRQAYVQYEVNARSTQFFDVLMYPVDEHDLIIHIEHAWLNRDSLVLVPDVENSEVSSRVQVNGYYKEEDHKIIEKAHSYQSKKGNPVMGSGEEYKSQVRMSVRFGRVGLISVMKLFIVLFLAVLLTFISPFAPDPSRYTVGALFTTAGANYIFASKLPELEVYSFAEIINIVSLAVIIVMIALLAILPVVIQRNGVIDVFEKRLMRRINVILFSFFITINFCLMWVAIY